ncbi:hypothetical protein DERF_014888 [Dermatophagoides farinae]|uniref:Uncharacterized protein n=1 Tax=Dermatophagoides farinae TaxID=6954 RepID=A0A922HN40_DERFA|nr:hypothetical protein DERF_014888 [Dermatophagoides farinae]
MQTQPPQKDCVASFFSELNTSYNYGHNTSSVIVHRYLLHQHQFVLVKGSPEHYYVHSSSMCINLHHHHHHQEIKHSIWEILQQQQQQRKNIFVGTDNEDKATVKICTDIIRDGFDDDKMSKRRSEQTCYP